YPARYLFTFLGHHGMLGVKGSPQWRTVTGGSGRYVEKLAATLPDIRLGTPVTGIRRHARGVELATDQGIEDFEAVVIATHPAQALGFLADATPAEKEALGHMPSTPSTTTFSTGTRPSCPPRTMPGRPGTTGFRSATPVRTRSWSATTSPGSSAWNQPTASRTW
ncbi:MAG TPA: hypothetical protein DEP82_00700, partial [Arthrobacter bacterium]|nr:hypothetical protein [Arthrobacter sp.]